MQHEYWWRNIAAAEGFAEIGVRCGLHEAELERELESTARPCQADIDRVMITEMMHLPRGVPPSAGRPND